MIWLTTLYLFEAFMSLSEVARSSVVRARVDLSDEATTPREGATRALLAWLAPLVFLVDEFSAQLPSIMRIREYREPCIPRLSRKRSLVQDLVPFRRSFM